MPKKYRVEAIQAWRYHADVQQKEFLVKWKGYEEPTWEPERFLRCPKLMKEFKASLTEYDRKCLEHPDPDGLTGFQRHAKYVETLGADGPHESDEDEESGKQERQRFYCLLRFDDSENYAEEVDLTEFYLNNPEEAFRFCEQRLIAATDGKEKHLEG